MMQSARLRSQAIETLKRQLVRTQMPRIQMTVILLATGAAGFLFSALLLHVGVGHTGIRYPPAVDFAYLIFFLLTQLDVPQPEGNDLTRALYIIYKHPATNQRGKTRGPWHAGPGPVSGSGPLRCRGGRGAVLVV